MTGPFSVEERLEILRIELATPEPRHFHHTDVAAAVSAVDRLRSEMDRIEELVAAWDSLDLTAAETVLAIKRVLAGPPAPAPAGGE